MIANELRRDAKAFRENAVYDSDGNGIRLIGNAERMEAGAKAIEALESALVKMRREAVLLLNNSEGCAANHYGSDCQHLGMPQWLIDSRRNIEQAYRDAEDALLRTQPTPENTHD